MMRGNTTVLPPSGKSLRDWAIDTLRAKGPLSGPALAEQLGRDKLKIGVMLSDLKAEGRIQRGEGGYFVPDPDATDAVLNMPAQQPVKRRALKALPAPETAVPTDQERAEKRCDALFQALAGYMPECTDPLALLLWTEWQNQVQIVSPDEA